MDNYRRAVRDFGLDDLDTAPKLAPDPVAAPEANGVEKSEPPADAVEPKAGVVLEKRDGVDADPKRDPDEELKRDVWMEAPVVGVANREDAREEAGVEDGVLKRDNPLPAEADDLAADVCGAEAAAGVAELANKPAT